MLSCRLWRRRSIEAVFQAGFLGILLIAEHRQRQLSRLAENLQIADEHLDRAGGQLGVHQIGRARHDLAVDADHPFRAHLFDVLEHRTVRIGQHLGDAIVVAQVDKQQPAVVAHPMHPARQTDGLPDV